MRTRRRRHIAARWVVQAAIIGAFVAASALFAGLRTEGHAGAVPAPQVLGERHTSTEATLTQTIAVTRPVGQIAIAVSPIGTGGEVEITVTDTRDEDKGWALTMAGVGRLGRPRPTSIEPTPAFADATGFVYAQKVVAGRGNVLVAAPAGHGLGIAHIRAQLASTAGASSGITFTAA